MGTGASISAADVPEQVTAEVAERLVGSSVWEATGRAYFDDNRPDHRDYLTREQFLDFARLEQQKAAAAARQLADSGLADSTQRDSETNKKANKKKNKKKFKSKKAKQRKNGSAGAETAEPTEAEMLKKIERKKRRKLMRIQKAKAAQELFAEDAATAELLREQYETDTAALERDIALQKEKMKAKLARRKDQAQKARLRKVHQRKLEKMREAEKSAADELAKRLEAIQQDYAKEKALAVENNGNLIAIRNKYEADVHAARHDAIRTKHEQVSKLHARLAKRREASAAKALTKLESEFSKVQAQLQSSVSKRVQEKAASIESQMQEELRVAKKKATGDGEAVEASRIRARFEVKRAHVAADLERQAAFKELQLQERLATRKRAMSRKMADERRAEHSLSKIADTGLLAGPNDEPGTVSPDLLVAEAKHILDNFHAQQQLVARATDEEIVFRKEALRRRIHATKQSHERTRQQMRANLKQERQDAVDKIDEAAAREVAQRTKALEAARDALLSPSLAAAEAKRIQSEYQDAIWQAEREVHARSAEQRQLLDARVAARREKLEKRAAMDEEMVEDDNQVYQNVLEQELELELEFASDERASIERCTDKYRKDLEELDDTGDAMQIRERYLSDIAAEQDRIERLRRKRLVQLDKRLDARRTRAMKKRAARLAAEEAVLVADQELADEIAALENTLLAKTEREREADFTKLIAGVSAAVSIADRQAVIDRWKSSQAALDSSTASEMALQQSKLQERLARRTANAKRRLEGVYSAARGKARDAGEDGSSVNGKDGRDNTAHETKSGDVEQKSDVANATTQEAKHGDADEKQGGSKVRPTRKLARSATTTKQQTESYVDALQQQLEHVDGSISTEALKAELEAARQDEVLEEQEDEDEDEDEDENEEDDDENDEDGDENDDDDEDGDEDEEDGDESGEEEDQDDDEEEEEEEEE
eukprot:INCI679.1.p1 GENE.INCI679.1~~INCI679.1.p1  ORF type:complete len:987 (+),score=328.94 INCI679.1:118-2961(+)